MGRYPRTSRGPRTASGSPNVISHHSVGTGNLSAQLGIDQPEPPRLLALVTQRVRDCDLKVVATQAVPYDNGGLALVWVLAESHLVLHLWPEEGCATVDLHVCDYRASNAGRARRLREALDELCFAPGSGVWREMAVGGVTPMERAGTHESAGLHQRRTGESA